MAALALAVASTANLGSARAGEVQLDVAAGGGASSWRGDGSAFGSAQVGYRFADLAAPFFLVRLGYGAVDTRMLTLLSLGAQVWGRLGPVRPFARLALAHQHEESAPALKADPFGAVFGVGDGIRHRGGFEGGLGVDIPFKKNNAWEFHGRVEGLVAVFPDVRGPTIYGGGTAGIGFNYTL